MSDWQGFAKREQPDGYPRYGTYYRSVTFIAGDGHPSVGFDEVDVEAIVAERCAPLVKALEDIRDGLYNHHKSSRIARDALRVHRERERKS